MSKNKAARDAIRNENYRKAHSEEYEQSEEFQARRKEKNLEEAAKESDNVYKPFEKKTNMPPDID